jgi:hypothetical protein
MTGYDALVASPFSARPITLYNEINNKRKISELFTVLSYTLRWSDSVCNHEAGITRI